MNRAERRIEAKTHRKAENMSARFAEKYNSMYEKYQAECKDNLSKGIDANFKYFFSVLGIVLKDDYHFNNDKIAVVFSKMEKRFTDYAENGINADDAAKILTDKTTIEVELK